MQFTSVKLCVASRNHAMPKHQILKLSIYKYREKIPYAVWEIKATSGKRDGNMIIWKNRSWRVKDKVHVSDIVEVAVYIGKWKKKKIGQRRYKINHLINRELYVNKPIIEDMNIDPNIPMSRSNEYLDADLIVTTETMLCNGKQPPKHRKLLKKETLKYNKTRLVVPEAIGDINAFVSFDTVFTLREIEGSNHEESWKYTQFNELSDGCLLRICSYLQTREILESMVMLNKRIHQLVLKFPDKIFVSNLDRKATMEEFKHRILHGYPLHEQFCVKYGSRFDFWVKFKDPGVRIRHWQLLSVISSIPLPKGLNTHEQRDWFFDNRNEIFIPYSESTYSTLKCSLAVPFFVTVYGYSKSHIQHLLNHSAKYLLMTTYYKKYLHLIEMIRTDIESFGLKPTIPVGGEEKLFAQMVVNPITEKEASTLILFRTSLSKITNIKGLCLAVMSVIGSWQYHIIAKWLDIIYRVAAKHLNKEFVIKILNALPLEMFTSASAKMDSDLKKGALEATSKVTKLVSLIEKPYPHAFMSFIENYCKRMHDWQNIPVDVLFESNAIHNFFLGSRDEIENMESFNLTVMNESIQLIVQEQRISMFLKLLSDLPLESVGKIFKLFNLSAVIDVDEFLVKSLMVLVDHYISLKFRDRELLLNIYCKPPPSHIKEELSITQEHTEKILNVTIPLCLLDDHIELLMDLFAKYESHPHRQLYYMHYLFMQHVKSEYISPMQIKRISSIINTLDHTDDLFPLVKEWVDEVKLLVLGSSA